MAKNAEELVEPAEVDLPLRVSENIQGNILAPFNKPYQRFLFISFMNRPQQAGTGSGISSAAEWRRRARWSSTTRPTSGRPRKKGHPPQQSVGVSFTSSGLLTLDPDRASDLLAYDAFRQGPLVDREYRGVRRTSPAVVGDVHRGDPRRWVVGGPGQYPVDAVVTVAADDERSLRGRAKSVQDSVADHGLAVLSWQDGRRRDRGEPGAEPFGFRDGISQPGIRGFTAPTNHNGRREAADQPGSPIIATGEFVLGYDGEGGSYRMPVVPCRPNGCATARSMWCCGCGRTSPVARRRRANSPHGPAARSTQRRLRLDARRTASRSRRRERGD